MNPTGWDLSCVDWAERLRTSRSLVPDLPLTAEGERAVAVLNKLRFSDVPGTPTFEEAGGDWFRDIVRALFGSFDPATRERMIREIFLLVPKKNSKTTDGALLMTAALLLNERPHANFILTAPVQDVTEIAFAAASGAIALDPVLEKKLHVRDHLKTIVHRETKAELQVMTFDPKILTGQKPSGGILIDELHVVAKMPKAASAVRQLRGGMLPFPESFLAFITTQSEEKPAGVFAAELTKAREIRDGKRRGAMLPVLYEFPRDMQEKREKWEDPANWPMVTPNAGKSISIPRLVEGFETAKLTGDDELRAWASQHLNVEIGIALRTDRWVGADLYEKSVVKRFSLSQLIERCEIVDAGIDGGGLADFLGFNATGRVRGSGEWISWSHAWAHPSVLERYKDEASRFQDFVNDGDLTIVETGSNEDIAEVAELAKQIDDANKLDKLGVDQHGLGLILDALAANGIENVEGSEPRIVGISQGWRLMGAIKTAERRLADGGLRLCDQPLMAYCFGNAKPVPKGNAIAIEKEKASGKIDPLMALFNSISLMQLNPQTREPQLIV